MSYTLAIGLIAALDALVIAGLAYFCAVPFLLDRPRSRHASSTQRLLVAELGPPTEWDVPRNAVPELAVDLAA